MIRITAQRAVALPPIVGRSEWEEEQSRWEAKLRRQAAVPSGLAPPGGDRAGALPLDLSRPRASTPPRRAGCPRSKAPTGRTSKTSRLK